MSETKFFREDEVEKIRKEFSVVIGGLFDERAEESKDAVNDLGLLLTYLMMDLEANPDIEKYFQMLESDVAKDIASRSLELARETIEVS